MKSHKWDLGKVEYMQKEVHSSTPSAQAQHIQAQRRKNQKSPLAQIINSWIAI